MAWLGFVNASFGIGVVTSDKGESRIAGSEGEEEGMIRISQTRTKQARPGRKERGRKGVASRSVLEYPGAADDQVGTKYWKYALACLGNSAAASFAARR